MPRGSPRATVHGKKNNVGVRVRQCRKDLRLTLRALGGRLATTTDGLFDEVWNPTDEELGRIEKGTRICSDLELLALARALECDVCWLLKGDG